MPNFSERLRLLRKSRDLTQEQIGDVVGKSKNNISQYERNARQADDETKKQLAIFFDVSMDYLIGITDDPTPISELVSGKDIDKELCRLIEKLKNDTDLCFIGKPMDNRTKLIILKMLKHTMDLAKDNVEYNE